MHSEQDPAPPATLRPPPRRPPAPKAGGLPLTRVMLGAGVLLVLAWYIGRRDTPDAATEAKADAIVEQAATPPAAAARTEAQVLRGEKSTTLASVDDARMTVGEQGRVLRIDGSVGRRFADDLQAALAANPSLQRIDITSGGGYAKPGLEAARMIRRRNLIVRVSSHCASMCVALWAAGAQRQLEPDAVIGLHAWDAQCDARPSPEREQCHYQMQFATDHDASYDSWLREAGFNAYLLGLQERTAAENIAVVNALQLWENGVDFSAVSRDGTPMSRADVQRYLLERHGRR